VRYVRADEEPAHDLKFRSADRYTATAAAEMDPDTLAADIDADDGGWWEIDFLAQPFCDPGRDPDIDLTGVTPCTEIWQKWIDAYVTAAPRFGGNLHLVATKAKYRHIWNGGRGVDVGLGIATTGLNYRSCLVINDPVVTSVTWNVEGSTLLMDGTGPDTWAAFLSTRRAATFVQHAGAAYDYVHLPTTQGKVTAIVAPTSGNNGTVSLEIDEDFPEQVPSFDTVVQVRTCSEPDFTISSEKRHFTKLLFTRDSYTNAYATLSVVDGVATIGGLSSMEINAFTNNGGVNTYVSVSGAMDCGQWYKTIAAPAVEISGKARCHMAMQHFALNVMPGAGGVKISDLTMVPRPNTNVMMACMRTGLGGNFNFGRFEYLNNTIEGTGDDGIGLSGGNFRTLTYVGATSFTAFSGSHWYGETIPIGSRFVIFNTTGSGYTIAAFGTITGAGSINPSTSAATYTIELGAGSSALPGDLTGYMAAIVDCWSEPLVAFCYFSTIRGRGIWSALPFGNYLFNTTELTTDEGILIHVNGGGTAGIGYAGGERINLFLNTVRRPNRDAVTRAGIAVVASAYTDAKVPATGYPIKTVISQGNMITGAPNMAQMFVGIERVTERDNVYDVVASGTPSPGQIPYEMGFTSKAVVGYANCKEGSFGRGTVMTNINGAQPYFGVETSPGLNVDCEAEFYDNRDAATRATGILARLGIGTNAPAYRAHVYEATGGADLMIESGNTDVAKLRLKTSATHMSVFVNSTGMFVRNEGNATNLLYIEADGDVIPAIPVSLGTTTNRWSAVATGNLNANGENVSFGGLPTADPAVASRIWNDRGVRDRQHARRQHRGDDGPSCAE
jgi:hypothetical protein